ncbi:acetolactate synthase isozyme1 large subunit [Aliishimia ponticola]|uniref:Acetolactate synthase isozyme1 large subunit n=1 Tax=Aliishimia ponticola TaxID=2499833 RepID=A0A4S4NFL7_9RHOB|nr:thiamine pyrophosphate-binding protein [Aliishimia ponticola]THH37397.1 acetolactate synthase isozyme1 large subunit [Aliishimia ponticola]
MNRPLGAQISHMLKARGVSHIFGIPGVHNQEMYRGIEEAGLVHVLARHEQGAGFMADGYARATGKPGVAYVITGPGLCNIMTPMGQAYSDSVPVLVISSCLPDVTGIRGQLHQMKDQRIAGAAVCDWSEEARDAATAYALVDRALMEFGTGRQRPKHIQVTIPALEGLADAARAPARDGQRPVAAQISADQVASVAEALAQARRPLFLLGGGLARGMAQADLGHVLQRFGAAALTSYAGRGLVAPDYPLSLGAGLARPGSAEVLAQSDCVVVIGCDLAQVDLWRDDAGTPPGKTIHVNIDPEVLARAHPADTRFLCDGADFLAMLGAGGTGAHRSEWTADDVAAIRGRWRAEVEAERPGILPVVDALRDCLPGGTMIYSDMTQFAYAAKEVWDMDRPGHWHHPTGFGTLGYATPAAIGGAVARPGKPTMAIIGDYGFQYTVQELATAVELELSLPIFLWDNGKLGEIEDSMVGAQIAPNAVHQRNPDFVKLAEAYGARSAAPQTLDAMQEAVRAAFDAPVPTLIRVTPGIAE